eukprot:scaffold2036_cov256-Pinguiococcus_pyrenoidosus.AAC.19
MGRPISRHRSIVAPTSKSAGVPGPGLSTTRSGTSSMRPAWAAPLIFSNLSMTASPARTVTTFAPVWRR